jgi:hypothetical protein|tara:strand:+ start:2608 stop:3183 length:576 start_codon:yes stop_codon:yes gene_type:complete
MSDNVSVAEIVVGEARISFEVPTQLYDLISKHAKSEKLELYSYNAETIIDMLRGFLPKEKKPPTHRQESYARSIARTLDLELPDSVLRSSQACGEFLSMYSEQYQEKKAEIAEFRAGNRALISTANKVMRWQLAKELLEQDVSIEEVAEKFGVLPPTIEKYLAQLEDWQQSALSDGTFEIVQELIQKHENR